MGEDGGKIERAGGGCDGTTLMVLFRQILKHLCSTFYFFYFFFFKGELMVVRSGLKSE